MPVAKVVQRFYPLIAFLGGFAWDALTIGQRVRARDFWQLGAYLAGAGVLSWWLAARHARQTPRPTAAPGWRACLADALWQAPYLLLQFFFGGIFSALFILYLTSSGHIGSWLTAAFLGALLVGNEFAGKRYGRHFTLIWGLFALNAILLFNLVLPNAAGSIDPRWFYASTAAGVALTTLLRRLAPGRPGRIVPVWGLAAVLLVAWHLDMIAPVPLVKQQMAVGHDFVRSGDRFVLQVEPAPGWQLWRDVAATAHVAEGDRLYGVASVFAPLGVSAALELRWEVWADGGWRVVYRNRFASSGGRERGFRGYSWVLNPTPGAWRLIVATQDGRSIGVHGFRVERPSGEAQVFVERDF